MNKFLTKGSVFLVPLRSNGYSVGVLIGSNGKGVCYGYFFGPKLKSESDLEIEVLNPDQAILIGMFGDLELLKGKWKIVGKIDRFEGFGWDIKPLARVDEAAGRAWLSFYDEKFNCINEHEISMEESKKYPYDRMMGAGSVEIRLTKLLD